MRSTNQYSIKNSDARRGTQTAEINPAVGIFVRMTDLAGARKVSDSMARHGVGLKE